MARLPGDGVVERERGEPSSLAAGAVNTVVREPEARGASPGPGPDVRPDSTTPFRRNRPHGGAGSVTHEPSLTDVAWTLVDRRWTVIAVAGVVLALAAMYLFVTPATYHTSILIQVEGRSRPLDAFQDLASLFQQQTPTEGEMRIMKSRTLLGAVVKDLGLDVEARPRTAPLIGGALARRWAGAAPAPARFGLDRFAWGGERIRVGRLAVADALLGEPLVVTALENHRFRLATSDGTLAGEGDVGKPVIARDGDRSVELLLSELTARPGTEFTVRKPHAIDVIEGLQAGLRIEEQGRATGLVEVSLSGRDPARLAAILDAVSSNYRRQSVERTSAEAAKTLAVLEAQLPVLKSNLEKAERALDAFHRKNGTANLSLGGEDLLRRLSEVDRQIAANDVEGAELTHRLTDKHWAVAELAEKTRRLHTQRAGLEARMQELPRLELASTRLSRRLRVATELYMLVLNRAEELRIVKSGWIGNARVLEQAVAPRHPVSPIPGLILVLGTLLGLGAGIGVALVRNAFDRSVRDPDEIEAGAGVAVMATIPRSRAQRKLGRRGRRGRLSPLSVVNPGDAAVEELRALRTSVQYALLRSRNNIIAIGGLAPNAGKSVVSVNLAHLLAAAEGRVLLVDGDLRRGVLHRYFGLDGQPGVVEVVTGASTLEETLHATDTRNLDVLTAGRLPENPAELLAGAPFEALLAELGRRYKAVIVDTPPILSVTDSALVGRHAGVNLLVLRAGEHSLGEISAALRRLVQNGVVIKGAVLNDVRPAWGRYGRTGRYRRYELVRGDRELH
jgi:tyrosine-protein kinase Etk/Wzc